MAYNNANNPNAQYQKELEVPTFNKKEIQAIAIEGVKSAIEKGAIPISSSSEVTLLVKDRTEISYIDGQNTVSIQFVDNGKIKEMLTNNTVNLLTFFADIGVTIPVDEYLIRTKLVINSISIDGNGDIKAVIIIQEDEPIITEVVVDITGNNLSVDIHINPDNYADYKGIFQLLQDTDKIGLIFKGI